MNLLKTLASVSSMTMFSRILGFIRDAIIARVFGASVATDAFFVAFKIPNLLRRIFAEGAFSQAFVPVLSEYKTQKTEEETAIFIQKITGFLSFILFWVVLIGIIASPLIIYITAGGFAKNPEKFDLSVSLLKITFPYILFISLSSLVGSILNTYNRFTIPAFTPSFLNISFIVFSLFLVPYFDPPIKALAWAVFFGGIIQLCFQLPYIKKLGFLKVPILVIKDPEVTRVLNLMLPALLGVSVAQISLIINTLFASFLKDGSVTWMYYADRLMELPTGVLGVALGTILLPTLSKFAKQKNSSTFSDVMSWGIRLCFLLAIPAAVGLAILSYPIIFTLFVSSKFTAHDALMTQQALIAYSIGLVALILIKVLAPGFYSNKNIKTPVKIAIFTLVLTQILNFMLVWKLQHVGLSLSISIGACVNAYLLFHFSKKYKYYQPNTGWIAFMSKIIVAVLLMALTLILLLQQQMYPFLWESVSTYTRIIQLFVLIISAVIVYFLSLFILGLRAKDFKRSIQA